MHSTGLSYRLCHTLQACTLVVTARAQHDQIGFSLGTATMPMSKVALQGVQSARSKWPFRRQAMTAPLHRGPYTPDTAPHRTSPPLTPPVPSCCRRIQACPGNVNPNCVSTSSNNDMFSPAWRASSSSARAALLDLDAAVLGGQGASAIKVLEAETPFGLYAAYAVPGRFSKPDMIEFLVKSEGVKDREWQGDKEGPLILYRSIAGTLAFVSVLLPVEAVIDGAAAVRSSSFGGLCCSTSFPRSWSIAGVSFVPCVLAASCAQKNHFFFCCHCCVHRTVMGSNLALEC
jgi:hypothetical protein